MEMGVWTVDVQSRAIAQGELAKLRLPLIVDINSLVSMRQGLQDS